MYCSHCGKEIADEAIMCTACGVPTKNYIRPNQNNNNQPNNNSNRVIVTMDNPGCGIGLISFLLPVVGIIIFIFNILSAKPRTAIHALIGAILGFVAGIIFFIYLE